jgi:hypothetical protein
LQTVCPVEKKRKQGAERDHGKRTDNVVLLSISQEEHGGEQIGLSKVRFERCESGRGLPHSKSVAGQLRGFRAGSFESGKRMELFRDILHILCVPKGDHGTIDRANAAADRMIARRLRRDPGLLREARRNLNRWISREGKRVSPVFLEWAHILDTLTRAELADFLEHGTSKARRLRQSTPFKGLFTRTELGKLNRIYEEAAD